MSDPLVVLAQLLSQAGDIRLVLRYIKQGEGLDFHTLALEHLTSNGWESRSTITQKLFQGDHPNQRWVSDLHSFLPSNGTAILKVGEGDRPWRECRSTLFYYSWRRWDLIRNVELARLKDCESPFEPL